MLHYINYLLTFVCITQFTSIVLSLAFASVLLW